VTQVRYIIISPVRNEQEYLAQTIKSVVLQTIRPKRWIIVNDGSSDETGRIIEEAARHHEWIRALHRPDRGARKAGSGVMETFYDGFKVLGNELWDYLVKLDGDVTFEAGYFERCFARFSAEPRLGIGGGRICNLVNGDLLPESKLDPPFHVRGATKIYRYECWQAIGGLVQATGWDTIDELKANMLGWCTRTFHDISAVHHRSAGAAYGTWSNWVKNGQANYATGYHPAFMLLKCAKRLFHKPYGIAALGLWVGFCKGGVTRAWRMDDPDFLRYFRGQQMRRFLGRPSLWSRKSDRCEAESNL
jgi:poly-beta-1,6-N-acetyl-D-glucosamine synthase